MYPLTVLSRVSNDHVGLRSWSKVIPGLDFDLVRHVGFCVVDDVFGAHCGHVAPLLPRVLPSPPHVVVEVWAVSLQVKEGLGRETKKKNQKDEHTLTEKRGMSSSSNLLQGFNFFLEQ